jgi:hypothetical protein
VGVCRCDGLPPVQVLSRPKEIPGDVDYRRIESQRVPSPGSHKTLRRREMDSNFQFRAIADGGPWSATRSLFKIIQVHPALMPSR